MTDLIERRKRRGKRPLRYGEDYQIIKEKDSLNKDKKRLPISDTHIDGA